jgi:hypothetical protein
MARRQRTIRAVHVLPDGRDVEIARLRQEIEQLQGELSSAREDARMSDRVCKITIEKYKELKKRYVSETLTARLPVLPPEPEPKPMPRIEGLYDYIMRQSSVDYRKLYECDPYE